MAIDPQSLYAQLVRLAETIPDLTERSEISTLQWLARAQALLAAIDEVSGRKFRALVNQFLGWSHYDGGEANKLMFMFYRALAIAELNAPASVQGAFIPAGNAFDALSALEKVLSSAKSNLLIVDPYMDEKTLIDFLPLAHEKIAIRLLADQASYKSSLRSASERWIAQYGPKRPLETKLAPSRTLHDRLIEIDEKEVWILTQSLNAFAVRAPASIIRVDDETAALKRAAYQAVWNSAQTI